MRHAAGRVTSGTAPVSPRDASTREPQPTPVALSPLLLFLAVFFGAGIWFTAQGEAMGFYQVRAPVAILPALALAGWIAHRRDVRAEAVLLRGMGHPNVQLMCLVFLLAGAFAQVSRASGAVDAVVGLAASGLPPSMLLPGLFLVASFISLAIGTSMGTIAAVVPIAVGLANATTVNSSAMVGAVVGGAMFGDNLSIISDSTIAATRTQGAAMRDKFRENFWIALPAALVTLLVLALGGNAAEAPVAPVGASPWLALPYVAVLVLALVGLDVVLVLSLGLLASVFFGTLWGPGLGIADVAGEIWSGFEGMTEVLLLSLLVGGLGALMNASGGLAWVSERIGKVTHGRKGARVGELALAFLASVTDIFTANNTVAILVSGDVARTIAAEHGVSPRRAASLLDIFASVFQGVLPFGAQLLLAGSLSEIAPVTLVGSVHYCGFLAVAALGTIAFRKRNPLASA